MNLLTDRPPVVDLDDYVSCDLAAVRWLRPDERMEIIRRRVVLIAPPARPVYDSRPPLAANEIETFYQMGTARPVVQMPVFDDMNRSREEVAESLKANTQEYTPQTQRPRQ